MRLNTKRIAGVPINTDSEKIILEYIRKYLKKNGNLSIKDRSAGINPLMIFTPNPEIITASMHDDKLRKIITKAQINIPDGWGVCWAMKRLYGIKINRLSGVDLMQNLCRLSSEEGFRIGLIGGKARVALSTHECLHKIYPNLSIHDFSPPELNVSAGELIVGSHVQDSRKSYFRDLVEKMKTVRIDILFVALGCPKQEYFIQNVKVQMANVKSKKPLLLMAVGGAFDYISGLASRPPEYIRNNNLEWLYRLIHQPGRLPRQLRGSEFFLTLLREPRITESR